MQALAKIKQSARSLQKPVQGSIDIWAYTPSEFPSFGVSASDMEIFPKRDQLRDLKNI